VTQLKVWGVMQSDDIADEINGYLEKFGVNWHDEHLPQIKKRLEIGMSCKVARILTPSLKEEAVKRYEYKNGKST
jgi:hypothetical protein